MNLKVGILSDYSGGVAHFIKILSPSGDSKVRIGDDILEFVSLFLGGGVA